MLATFFTVNSLFRHAFALSDVHRGPVDASSPGRCTWDADRIGMLLQRVMEVDLRFALSEHGRQLEASCTAAHGWAHSTSCARPLSFCSVIFASASGRIALENLCLVWSQRCAHISESKSWCVREIRSGGSRSGAHLEAPSGVGWRRTAEVSKRVSAHAGASHEARRPLDLRPKIPASEYGWS